MTSPTAAITRVPATSPTKSDAVLDRLRRLHPRAIDLSLGRVERLLYRLGNPERDLPPVVHVAGTNGKGSVIAYLRAMLEAAGRRVHVYTSPHLVRFHERIRLAGSLIDEAELAEFLTECEWVNGGQQITEFEVTTAAAFLAFMRHPADILLLETGLGGRFDATNVVEQPLVSAITPVSIDHVQFLGDTLEQIAFEKAGILKPGVPAVIGPQPPEALAVIEARATAQGVPLLRAGREWTAEPSEAGFDFRISGTCQTYDRPVLQGAYQIDNAATALAVAEQLEAFGLDEGARRRGIAEAEWPGRLQILSQGPLPARLPTDWELWLDGGHNAAAGQALAEAAQAWQDRPLHLIFGMMNTKAVRDFLKPLVPLAETLHAITIPGEPNALSPEEAAAEARVAGLAAQPAEGLEEALDAITGAADQPARILICGSLYLAGRVLALNG
jgi:dihydrofolate synthase/folylpolyglutamate synthase